jgi:hypothetical protein
MNFRLWGGVPETSFFVETEKGRIRLKEHVWFPGSPQAI